MGYLTTVTFYNDDAAIHEKMGGELFKIIQSKSYQFQGADCCHGMIIQNSRHADDQTVYVQYNGTVLCLDSHTKEFKDLADIEGYLEKFISVAEQRIKSTKNKLKEIRSANKCEPCK